MNQPPTLAKWLLGHFGCSPNNDAVIGDLDEQYRHGHSRRWYWRQVVVAIVVSFFKEVWSNKVRSVIAIVTGWISLYICYRLLRPPILLLWADWFPPLVPSDRVLNLTVDLVSLLIVIAGGELTGRAVSRVGGSSRRAMLLFYLTSIFLASTWTFVEVSFAESLHDRAFAWPIVAATVVWTSSILHGGRFSTVQRRSGA